MAGRARRAAAIDQAVRLDTIDDQSRNEADDDRAAAQKRCAVSQSDRAFQHRQRRHRQRDLSHGELRRASAEGPEGDAGHGEPVTSCATLLVPVWLKPDTTY